MQIDLSEQDVETLMESLDYATQRVADAEGTPYKVRQENLSRIDALRSKIRGAGKPPASPPKP